MSDEQAAGMVQVPREPTDRMSQAAFEAAGSPSDWCGFDEMWRAAVEAWISEARDAGQ